VLGRIHRGATGLANRNGFVLLNYREFSPRPTAPGHVAAPGFGLRDNVLSLNGPLASNLYSLFWTNDTFDTTADYLATGQVFFAGGHNNGFDNDGFAVVAMRTMSGNTTFTDAVPWAIFGNASGTASLVTGSGNDVVLSKAGALTVVYAGITPPCSTTARRMTMASSTPTRSPSSPPSTAARRPRAISSWWGCRRRDGADTLRCRKTSLLPLAVTTSRGGGNLSIVSAVEKLADLGSRLRGKSLPPVEVTTGYC